MKRKHWSVIWCVLVMCVLSFITPPVLAAELPPGVVIGDDQGIMVEEDGDYLVEVTDVMPGKTWTTTISMINMEENSSYQLAMLVSPSVTSGSLDLSQAIQMTLWYDGKQVYDGPVSGISEKLNLQKDRLNLGVFNSGDSRALKAEFSLSGEYTEKDFVEKNKMENVWHFYAVKSTTTPSTDDPTNDQPDTPITKKPIIKLPQTGEEWREVLIYICLGLFLILLILLLWKSNQRTNKPLE